MAHSEDDAVLTGAYTELLKADKVIQKICDTMKEQAESKTNRKYEHFKAVEYRSQVVNGINYKIKVHVGGRDYVHLLVFEPMPNSGEKMSLTCFQENKTKDDELECGICD